MMMRKSKNLIEKLRDGRISSPGHLTSFFYGVHMIINQDWRMTILNYHRQVYYDCDPVNENVIINIAVIVVTARIAIMIKHQ